ncbi:hypothetical protein GC56T2_0199 [Geobacillus sp. C56-T2]|nr:hypothetical protein GC56T2_0199 [Geobacillus sp. C56-T2]
MRLLFFFLHEWYNGNKVKHILFEVLKETLVPSPKEFKDCLVGKTEVQRCYSSFSV